MPADPPDPHGETLDALRAVLAQLQAAVPRHPADPTLLPAVAAVGAAVALLGAPIEPPTPHR
jgi:hypothetical protein